MALRLEEQAELSARVQRLLQDMEGDLERGVLPFVLFNDPEIYQLELQRIFGRCWVFLGHESEIPSPGDYVVRYIGQDHWILVRDEEGQIRCLFDSCRHRGTQICRADKGNASHFRCPYHAWTYKNTGELVGIPNKAQAFKLLDEQEWGLYQVPHLGTHRGLMFASLDPDAVSLDEYLGDFRWYLDMQLALCPDGMEVVGDPHRWRFDGDWKSAAENFAGDSYYTQSLHRSILEVGLIPGDTLRSGRADDVHVDCSGHQSSIRRTGSTEPLFFGYPSEVSAAFKPGILSEEQFEVARGSVVHVGNVFPNLSYIHMPGMDDPAKPPAGYLSFRQWQPRGPGKVEAWSWVLVPRSAPEEYKRRAQKVAVATFSPSGNFEQDDTTVWPSIARAAGSVFVRQAGAKLNYQMGMDGMGDAKPHASWPGPGLVYDSNLEDGVQRALYRHWLRWMTRG
jgi:phenylpropionate dioxygenase-like ring-hydroxylating dioxygenase large terminal subunit